MSSSVLYQRLGELTEAALIERNEAGRYLLTGIGSSLSTAIEPLDSWARTWAGSGDRVGPAAPSGQQ
jgi:DNA-binding HxlR family transcriptional regulator